MSRTLLLYGPPGTGKSRTLVQLFLASARVSGPENVGAITYTRAGAEELRDRLATALEIHGNPSYLKKRLPWVGTIHSLAFRRLGCSHGRMVTSARLAEFCAEVNLEPPEGPLSSFVPDELDEPIPSTSGSREISLLVSADAISRHRMLPFRAGVLLLDPRDLLRAAIGLERLSWLKEQYDRWKQENEYLDYQDLLEQGRSVSLPVHTLLVDEVQDQSPLLFAVTDAWGYAPGVVNYALAGDPYQCQPAGTMVRTVDGEVPIEDLDPERHRLVSYDRNGSYVVGLRDGYAFTKQQTAYTGMLVEVQVGGNTSISTGHHRWPFLWSDCAKEAGTTAVYLMRRDGRYRIGWCQLFDSQGSFHLGRRASIEGADAAWIVKLVASKSLGYLEESAVAAEYGIPTMPFNPVNGANHITQEILDQFWERLAFKSRFGAEECLADRGLDPRYPFWSKKREYAHQAGVRTPWVTQACNLIEGYMKLAVIEGKERAWLPIEYKLYPDDAVALPVYALNVEPHHLYIADGIVTHNSIYKFAGGDPDLFLKHEGRWRTIGNSWRLSPQAATYAKSILGRAGWTDPKLATWTGIGGEPKDGTTLYLARTNNLVDEMFRTPLIDKGVPFLQYRGRAPLDTNAGAAYRFLHRLQEGQEQSGVDILTRALKGGVVPRGRRAYLESIKSSVTADQVETLFGRPLKDLKTKLPYADYFLKVLEQHGPRGLYLKPKVAISTIHGSKGREADLVVLARSWAIRPATEARQDPKPESLCAYVAATRHRKRLIMRSGGGGRAYDFPEREEDA